MTINETKEVIYQVVLEGGHIGNNSLGIIERDGNLPIVPKNLVVFFDGWDDCPSEGEECSSCEFGGCCNMTKNLIAIITRIGGKEKIIFETHCGYQIGDTWSKWVRYYNWE